MTRTGWTFLITAMAVFMAALDNLVVTTALPVIRADFGASISELEWMVNAYTLTFAVLLLTGAALGDRFGRKRLFIIGLFVFTAGSAAAALSTTANGLILARAIQGVGGAILTPLSLTILSAAVRPERRAVALGAWGGIAGLAIAIGPLVGGAIAEGLEWQWIFWVNVPIGLIAIPLAWFRLEESYGPAQKLDLPGLGLVSAGLFAIVWALVNGNDQGWTSAGIVASLGIGAVLIALFVGVGGAVRRADAPPAPLPVARLRRRERRLDADDVRHVRLDLPAGPVLPGRAGLQPARSRRSDPPLDLHAGHRCPDRGPRLDPHRDPSAPHPRA